MCVWGERSLEDSSSRAEEHPFLTVNGSGYSYQRGAFPTDKTFSVRGTVPTAPPPYFAHQHLKTC